VWHCIWAYKDVVPSVSTWLQHLLELEQDLMQEETPLPVYFATETPQLLDIYADVKTSMNSDQAGSAAEGNDICPGVKARLLY